MKDEDIIKDISINDIIKKMEEHGKEYLKNLNKKKEKEADTTLIKIGGSNE